jgi:hypothetical protein
MAKPNDDVKAHLQKRGINPATLPGPVIDALNAFSPGELKKVDKLGEALTAAATPSCDQKLSAVH